MTSLNLARFQPVEGESLSGLLRKFSDRLRFRKSKNQAQIAGDAWLDESYVSRLISGERAHPSRDALILLGAWGLELAVHELDEVLMAADYPSSEPAVAARARLAGPPLSFSWRQALQRVGLGLWDGVL